MAVTVFCPSCKKDLDPNAMEQRPVEGFDREGAVEVGLVCGACGHWTHAYYWDNTLARSAQRVKEAQEAMQTALQAFQTFSTQDLLDDYERAHGAWRKAQGQHQRLYDNRQAHWRRLRRRKG